GVFVELQGVEVLPAAVDHVDTREAGSADLLAVAEVDLIDLRRGYRAEDLLREAGIVRAREVRAVRPALRRRGAAVGGEPVEEHLQGLLRVEQRADDVAAGVDRIDRRAAIRPSESSRR